MKKNRKIKRVIKSKPALEGAGVRLKRAFGFGEESLFDPFLLLDDFRADNPRDFLPGFPWHPHRGIETITYVLSGDVAHGDSLGHQGVIGSGDVQWMTAGSGIIHQEMPQGDAQGRMAGFQLWANLPARQKMMDPRYRDVRRDQIPEVALGGGITVRVIAGAVQGIRGPVRDIVIDPEYLDVSLPAHAEFVHPTKPGHTVCAYVIGGRGSFGTEDKPAAYAAETGSNSDLQRDSFVGNTRLVLFGDGGQIVARTENEPARFLLISGRPLGEPIAWRGPIVMNTQQELQVAFEEYENGTFLKHRPA
ncbi:MAG: pirin family protein [Kiritimatiellaeota bacterium]|nr:pirin family protein [Kiritimatiellota bacterium]